MKILVKKSILRNYINKIKESYESRGDRGYDKNTTNFYGNFGSVKSQDELLDDQENPIEATPQMAVQLSVDEPPVDDPQYVPSSLDELCLAAARISKEVPHSKIEYFYRKLHEILDMALDEDDLNLFEAIDYESITNPAHKKLIKGLIDQAVAMASRDADDKNFMSTDDAAKFVAQNRTLSRYPDISFQDIVDEIEDFINFDDEESEEEQLASAVAGVVAGEKKSDILTEPPGSLTDLSPPGGTVPAQSKGRRIAKGVVKKIGSDPEPESEKIKSTKKSRLIRDRRKDVIDKDATDVLDKKSREELEHLMAEAYSEFIEMDEFAATWDWTNYKYEAPLLKVMFDLIKILHQLSYRVLQANYINKYGGYIYDPDADMPGGKKGGFVLEKQGPTSRPEAKAMINRINSDFGLTYENMMRQKNILKMSYEELFQTIERAMIGIFRKIPELYQDFIQAAAVQNANNMTVDTDIQQMQSEAFTFVANVLTHKYRGESEILDRDLINVAIAGIFKRCLLELPAELGVSTNVGISLDALGKKKKKTINKVFGFNLVGAMKRFEKLRKDPSIAKQIKKLMPKLILGRITTTLSAKVTQNGKKYNFEDKDNGLGIEVKESELKKKIKEYVDGMLKGKQPSFEGEEEFAEPEEMTSPYDPEQEEKDAKARLKKEQYEVRKMVQEMEKMVASGDWMHIAPLFGFSGAPGIRSWYLRYPQRKFMIMTAARSDNAPKGAVRYLEVFRKMRENLGDSLITLNSATPGVLDLMIDEISSKSAMATSDQQMIDLLEEMRDSLEELMNLYYDAESYESLEEENPEELKRLSNTPGGSLLRFSLGSVFDKIIKDMEKEWHAEMKAYLETKNGLNPEEADSLAYYFTGQKNKPSKGDFEEDKGKLSSAAKAFINVGIEASEFFEALRYSQGWFFTTLDRELREGIEGDNYYNMVRDLTSQPLYVRDEKTKKLKLDKKVYTNFKKLIQGKNGAVSAYLDNLAIEQFQQKTLEKVGQIKKDSPEIFNEIAKFINDNI